MPGRPLRILGHPVHPMVAGFPVALWLSTVVWDGVALFSSDPFWSRLAFWTLLLGLVAALPAGLSGFWDFATLPSAPGTLESLAWRHFAAMTTAVACFVASLGFRWPALGLDRPPWIALAASALGALATLVGGWLGGEMVFRHGAAVETRETRCPETRR